MKICHVKLIWDDGVWFTQADEELGIVLESASFDTLLERVRVALPEMLELNFDYHGPVKIVFEAQRVDVMEATAV